MSKNISQFRFKQFSVSHHRSSMKVGVDGVLIGSWADVEGVRNILDVGTGCGLIALMMAQRAPTSMIDAIDVDVPSIEEAMENVEHSPWKNRIRVAQCGFAEVGEILKPSGNYDLIISNPPYFDSGVSDINSAREKARHQGELSPSVLLNGSLGLLTPGGSLAMVVPSVSADSLEMEARGLGYSLTRKCMVRGHENAPYKRVLLQWRTDGGAGNTNPQEERLTLENAPGIPTEDYRSLCRDFYLRF